DAEASVGVRDRRAEDEGRLRQIHLARQRLHRRAVEAVGVGEHGEGVAGEGTVGEDVADLVTERGRGHAIHRGSMMRRTARPRRFLAGIAGASSPLAVANTRWCSGSATTPCTLGRPGSTFSSSFPSVVHQSGTATSRTTFRARRSKTTKINASIT